MKMSKLSYKVLDRMYAATESNDRANRGVTLHGWSLAAAFSVIVWAAVYFAVKSF